MVFFYITACIVGMFSAMPKPCLSAQLSQMVEQEEQGRSDLNMHVAHNIYGKYCLNLLFLFQVPCSQCLHLSRASVTFAVS